jgi:glucuronokinase
MDFDRSCERMVDGFPCYRYERLDPACLPPLYLAYHDALSEPTEVFHNNIRERYNQGDEPVVSAMRHFAALAAGAREALAAGDHARLAALMNENFDTRRRIYSLPPWQVEMVEAARACGASAKFAGSGGAIVGTYSDEEGLAAVRRRLLVLGSRTILPQVVS